MKRTTILMDDGAMLYLRQKAQQRRTTLTHVIREAVAEYIAREPSTERKVSITAVGHSGETAVSERAEQILRDEMGEYGWRRGGGKRRK